MSAWVLIAGDFTRHGGMDRANLGLAEFLARTDPVTTVAHRVDTGLLTNPNVTVRLVPRPFGKHLLGGPKLRRAGMEEARVPGRRVVANGGNCDAGDICWVHIVHAAHPALPAGNLLRRAKTVAFHRLAARAERKAVRHARVVVCNSRKSAREVVEHYAADPDRVKVVYLGTDPARFPLIRDDERRQVRKILGLADRPWVGFVGQLGNRVKGFDTLYAAWSQLCRRPDWDAGLLVTGSGAELPAWQARVTAHGLADRVTFLGFRDDVSSVLAACDALAHPARYDAYGLGVHEALCRGLPVVVSAAAGVAERYPAALRELVLPDAEDVAGLVDRLRAWRAGLDSWRERVRPFADELRAYSWDDMGAAFAATVG